MSGVKYADRAVASLLAYVESGYPAALRAVETAQGLASGTISDPVGYVPAHVPDDTRSPLVQVWCGGGARLPEDEAGRNGVFGYACVVSVGFASDADVETGQKRGRQYATALLDLIDADNTLGAATRIVHAIDSSQNFEGPRPDAATRYAFDLGVDVIVYEG